MKALVRLNKYFLKYKWRFFLGILMVSASNLFKVFQPRVVREAFDSVGEQLENSAQVPGQELLNFGLLLVGLAVMHGVFLFFSRQTVIVMSRLIEFDLKNEVFRHYQQLSSAFFKRNNTGDLVNRIGEDVSKVRMYLGPAIMYSTNFLVMTIFTVTSMFMVNVKLTLFVLIPLPILAITIYKISRIINIKSDKVQRELSNLSTFVQEAFSGIRVLKAFAKEDEYAKNFTQAAETYRSSAMSLVRTHALFHPFMVMLIGLSTIITIYVGGVLAINGEGVSVGNIAEFVIYVNMLTWPVASLGWVTSLVQQAAASQKRLNEFLDTQPDITSGATKWGGLQQSVEFKNVSFRYPDSGILALDGLNLTIEKGKTVAIVGRTGCGKSTVAQLINRLFDPDSGEVLIDGHPIQTMDLKDLREGLAYVPQEVFLFSDTIGNNIAFGTPGADQGSIQLAAEKADLTETIANFPKGFDTLLGERGINLSGGQKQRLSIARALIKDAELYILDDSLSAVDTQTENRILRNLKGEFQEKTVLLISHRISSVQHADYIYVIQNGKIVESGKHDDLIDQRGEYFDLAQQQPKEATVE